jgi:glycosyltransferase involved in cell wall biosynthesis
MEHKNRVKVTIGLCVKDNEKTICETVRSIVNQDFESQEMEVIVVDGKSRDRTLSIIRDFLNKKAFKDTYLSENVGLGFARQLVVQYAKGEYIIWVDGDLILDASYVRNMVSFMDHNPSVGVARGSMGLLPDDNWIATLENIGYVLDSLRNRGHSTSHLLGTEGAIFRIRAIQQAGGFNCKVKGAMEDMDLTNRIRRNGWSFFITNSIFYERQRSSWKSLWRQHYWYGYGFHFFKSCHKNSSTFNDKSNDRFVLSFFAYKLTHRKTIFLLPINFIFKRSASLTGFVFAHFDGYGHDSERA